ncbi:acyltransferase [Pendulispora brunnea]|uniref:Acyltransferase n=1 Tax=Pendulispora brunnea TaxID=2905690 RepID=A0ABZ2K5Z3_9BACT
MRNHALPHLPALDGLRGLALLGVLFFHANGALPGGYLGVDLFFVLSGFLITSLLLAEHRGTGRIELSSFWVRRAKRLMPALLSVMLAVALYSRFFAKPDELAGLRAEGLATLAYVANWRTIMAQKSYWDLFVAPSPLEHTWSLAIEEQFYVLWPLLVALLLHRFGAWRNRAVLVASLALTALSMVTMFALFDPEHVSRVYLGTDTRAAGILAGAALAAVLPPNHAFSRPAVRVLDALGLACILGLGVAWCSLEGQDPFLYRGGLWLTEAGALVLIACATQERSLVARALSFRPLTLVGTISYGVYLWHWPIDVWLTQERLPAGRWLPLLQIALTFAVAIVSYRFLEQPIRHGRLRLGRPVFVVPSTLAIIVFLVVRATAARASSMEATRDFAPPPSSGPAEPPPGEPVDFRVMLVGDSTANSLGWGLRGLHAPGVAIDLMGRDGCTMLWDTCDGHLWAQHTASMRPNASLVFLGGAFLHGLTVKNRWHKACHREWNHKFQETLTRRLDDLKSEDTRVWAVTVPYPLGPWDRADFRAEVDCINTTIRKAVASSNDVGILDLAEYLCPKGSCQREHDGVPIRPDGAHYSVEGAADLARWVFERIRPR